MLVQGNVPTLRYGARTVGDSHTRTEKLAEKFTEKCAENLLPQCREVTAPATICGDIGRCADGVRLTHKTLHA